MPFAPRPTPPPPPPPQTNHPVWVWMYGMPIRFFLILTLICLFQVLENEIFKFEEQICDFEVTFVHYIWKKYFFFESTAVQHLYQS
jgi:hypothetical protein